MTCRIIRTEPRPYGASVLVETNDGTRTWTTERIMPDKHPTPEALEALRVKCEQIAQAETNAAQEQVRNEELAAYATAAKAILDRSDKLTPELRAGLEQLEGAVKTVAGAPDLDAGTSATTIVQKILSAPEVQAQPELKRAIETALRQVIETTGGVL